MSSRTKTEAKPKKGAATRKTKAKARPKRAVKEGAQVPKAEAEEPVAKPKRPAETTQAPTPQIEEPPETLGKAPGALVSSRHVDSMRERAGRGFSFGELDTAGVPVGRAKREGLSVDVRRRSVLEGNVEALKVWYRTPAPGGDAREQREG